MSALDKFYVSPVDKFIYEFDATHHKSTAQQQEIEKNEKIAHARDIAKKTLEGEKIWHAF
jgi:hypothetical protein